MISHSLFAFCCRNMQHSAGTGTYMYTCIGRACAHTRKICILLSKAMATQSGCAADHCSWLISASAV